jgi:hypothetical protein
MALAGNAERKRYWRDMIGRQRSSGQTPGRYHRVNDVDSLTVTERHERGSKGERAMEGNASRGDAVARRSFFLGGWLEIFHAMGEESKKQISGNTGLHCIISTSRQGCQDTSNDVVKSSWIFHSSIPRSLLQRRQDGSS